MIRTGVDMGSKCIGLKYFWFYIPYDIEPEPRYKLEMTPKMSSGNFYAETT